MSVTGNIGDLQVEGHTTLLGTLQISRTTQFQVCLGDAETIIGVAHDIDTLTGVFREFIMGDELLVAPVLKKGATSRKVVLPPGKWKADDGQVYDGPATIEVAAPLSRVPYFEKQHVAVGANLANVVNPKLP